MRVFLRGVDCAGIGEEIHEAAFVALRPQSDIQGDGASGYFAEFGDAVSFDLEFICDLDIGGFATQFGSEGGADSAQALNLVH